MTRKEKTIRAESLELYRILDHSRKVPGSVFFFLFV